jgi:hypothetical protein
MIEALKESKKSSIFFNKYFKYLSVALLIIAAAFAVTPSSTIFYNKDGTKIIGFNDFMYYYGSATLVANGDQDKIYDTDFQQKNFSNIIGVPTKKLIPYLYPPQSLLFFTPLADFSPKNAFSVWKIVNIIATLLLISLLYFSKICTIKYSSLMVATLLVITNYPWVAGMGQGQVVILMTIGIWGSQLLAKNKHVALAAILMVLTAFKPPLILAPALYLLIIHGKSLWYSIIAASVTVMAICSAIFGVSIWQSYIEIMLIASHETDGLGASLSIMGNIRSFLLLLLGEEYLTGINLISSILWVTSILVTIYMAFKIRNKAQKTQELGFGLAIAASCIFSPWLHIYSLVLLIIPVGYLVKYYNFQPRYMYIGGLINFNLLAMYIDGLIPKLNSVLWVPAQTLLIVFIVYHLIKENKKACTVSVVS